MYAELFNFVCNVIDNRSSNMSIRKDIEELLAANVISTETAQNIEKYYETKPSITGNRLLVVFSILGSILIGLGIILIVAHNWDSLPRFSKAVFAFIPLVISQGLCFYSLIKQPKSLPWLESSATLLFFGVGVSIAMIAQIYNIPSSEGTFMLTWCLLTLPMVYLMRSSTVALLYISIATYYVSETSGNPLYFLLLVGILPYYYYRLKSEFASNFTAFLNWGILISLLIGIGFSFNARFALFTICYLCLFSLSYQFSEIPLLKTQKNLNNSYKTTGLIGMAVIMLFFSFEWFWQESHYDDYNEPTILLMMTSIFITMALLIYQNRTKLASEIDFIGLTGLIYTVIYFLMKNSQVLAQWSSNLVTFLIGMYFIRKGSKRNHLGLLNYGLLLISALILCRFFDSNLSFVLRGIIFILIGICLFVINYFLFKKRRNNEKQ